MEKNWNNIGPVTRKSANGKQHVFPSLKDAVIRLSPREINMLKFGRLAVFTPTELQLRSWRYDPPSKADNYIFIDMMGFVIPLWKVKEVFFNIDIDEWCAAQHYKWWGRSDRYKFRNGPVWGICSYSAGGMANAHVSTNQEIRENDFINNYDEEAKWYGIKVRGRRCKGELPSCYDDRNYGSYYQTNWKHFRKNQYKEK